MKSLDLFEDDLDELVQQKKQKLQKLDIHTTNKDSFAVCIPQKLEVILFFNSNRQKESNTNTYSTFKHNDDPVATENKQQHTLQKEKIEEKMIHKEENNSIFLRTPLMNKYVFKSNQYIIFNQSFWDKDFSLAKSISEKIKVIEAKMDHATDIVVNCTTGIYITTMQQLIQGDGTPSNEFIVLKQSLLNVKQHFHEVYVVATMQESQTCKFHMIEKLQKLQIICLSINICVLFVSQQDCAFWCLEIIKLKRPQILKQSPFNEDVLENEQDLVFLGECGLTLFQAVKILEQSSLEQFIQCSIEDKLQKFGNIITPDLLVRLSKILSKSKSKSKSKLKSKLKLKSQSNSLLLRQGTVYASSKVY